MCVWVESFQFQELQNQWFCKGSPLWKKNVILINFHGFALNRVILILFTVMIIEKILLFWKLTWLFFEKFVIDNHHLNEKNLKKVVFFLYIFYLVKTWISKISSRIFSRAILPTTRPSKKVFYFSYFLFVSLALNPYEFLGHTLHE